MTRLALLAATSVLSLAACRDAPAPPNMESLPVTETAEVEAPSFAAQATTVMPRTPALAPGMVSAAHPLAVEAGLDILQRGGTAVDAAVAVQAALGLVEPQSSGLGGGAFMVVYDPETGEVWTYDGRETAPSDVDAALFQVDGEPMRYFDGIVSGKSTGVPGAMAMLGMAHGDYGRLDWSTLFEPVIPMAADGFTVGERLPSLLQRVQGFGSPMGEDADAGPYFFPEGQPLAPGTLLKNPAYAETLRALQDSPRALIEGPIAEAIAAKVAEEPRPGTLSVADMAAYQPEKKPALCGDYRGHTICGARPPASGGTAILMALGIMENFDMADLGPTTAGWHHFIEASRLAYADRDAYVAAPEHMEVGLDRLLDESYLDARALLISPDSVMETVEPGLGACTDATPDSPGTSHFTVVDGDGMVVSMTTTIEGVFGSQRMTNGFLLNNQLTDFSFRDVDAAGCAIPNRVAPGKRPRSSMSPTIVFAPNGEFLFGTGSPGGNSIIAYTLKTIVGVIDWGLSPQEAADLPNVIARSTPVSVESGAMDADLLAALRAMGHEIDDSRGEISGIHIVYRHPDGRLEGAADSRREGVALPVVVSEDDTGS